MFVREFTAGHEAPGTISTGSKHLPYTGTFAPYPDSNLCGVLDDSYHTTKDYDDERVWAHFYGFGVLSPITEVELGSAEIGGTIFSEYSIICQVTGGSTNEFASILNCGPGGKVFRPTEGLPTSSETSAALVYDRPQVYSPPGSTLSVSEKAGLPEMGTTQNLELMDGNYLPWYFPSVGTNRFLDRTQQHPCLIIDGSWVYGSAARTEIESVLEYDPEACEFVANTVADFDEYTTEWPDFFTGTPVLQNSDDVYQHLLDWPGIAKLDSGFAQEDADFPYSTLWFQPSSLTVSPGGGWGSDEQWVRDHTYLRFRPYTTAHPVIRPWGNVVVDGAGYNIDPGPEAINGCESTAPDYVPGPGRSICSTTKPLFLGLGLYLKLDENIFDYIDRWGGAYSSYTDSDNPGLSWYNFMRVLYESVEPDTDDDFVSFGAKGTNYADEQGSYTYLLQKPGNGYQKLYLCGIEGYAVVWPTSGFPGYGGPPASWQCDNNIELDGAPGVCNVGLAIYGTNIKIVTEDRMRTFDFLDADTDDLMAYYGPYITSDDCDNPYLDYLAWHFCPCKCPDCGGLLSIPFTDVSDLYYPRICGYDNPSNDPCSMNQIAVRLAMQEETETIELDNQVVYPGWLRYELEWPPGISPLVIFYNNDPLLPNVVFPEEIEYGSCGFIGEWSYSIKNLDTEEVQTADSREMAFRAWYFGDGTSDPDTQPEYDLYSSSLTFNVYQCGWGDGQPGLVGLSDLYERQTTRFYLCEDSYLPYDDPDDAVMPGIIGSVWVSTRVIGNFDPNGSQWEFHEFYAVGEERNYAFSEPQFGMVMAAQGTGITGFFDDYCDVADLVGNTIDLCGHVTNPSEEAISLACGETEDPYCRPQSSVSNDLGDEQEVPSSFGLPTITIHYQRFV